MWPFKNDKKVIGEIRFTVTYFNKHVKSPKTLAKLFKSLTSLIKSNIAEDVSESVAESHNFRRELSFRVTATEKSLHMIKKLEDKGVVNNVYYYENGHKVLHHLEKF